MNNINTRNISAIIMAGGKGSRLKDLTLSRAKPAMYYGGEYRIIDFVMSNCVNSRINKVGIVTQYKSHSLIKHLFRAWGFLNDGVDTYMEILPASQQHSDHMWYRGTADSIAQNLPFLKERKTKYTLILAGDHIYKMDYSIMLDKHIQSGAPCSVGCIVVSKEDAKDFGVMKINENNRIVEFVEKSSEPPVMPNDNEYCLASMGIYLFETDYLIDVLLKNFSLENSSHDFGKDIIPEIVSKGDAYAHPFPESCVKSHGSTINYWKDVGTVDSFLNANLELTEPLPKIDLYDNDWPIKTFRNSYKPCKFLYNMKDRKGHATDCIISSGCIISGGYVNKSVLFNNVRINSYTKLDSCLIFPGVEIHRRAHIKNAIIDKRCNIPEGLIIGQDPTEDAKRFYRTDKGTVVVTREMLNKL